MALAFLLMVSFACEGRAAEVRVAVAANFAGTLKALSADFTQKTAHSMVIVSGATGKFYAQIKNGAPFEVLLAADDTTPVKLERDGLAVPGTRFTYAFGRLVLFSAKPGFVDAAGDVLTRGAFEHLSIANPKLAPYGAAAITALERLRVLEAIRPKLVQGENIAQAFEFVVSGNAELGFVALSQVMIAGKFRAGSFWLVPDSLHAPIRQDAVLLEKGANNAAAVALLDFLKTDGARAVIGTYGYGLPPARADGARTEPR